MAVRYFALTYGIVFLLVGIAGFIPGLVTPMNVDDPNLAITTGAGHLFGLFPVNVIHNILHVIFGVWGLAVWKSVASSLAYARGVAIIYGLLIIMGFIPVLMTTFGLAPLWGHNIWLHAILAAVAAYFAFIARPTDAAVGR